MYYHPETATTFESVAAFQAEFPHTRQQAQHNRGTDARRGLLRD